MLESNAPVMQLATRVNLVVGKIVAFALVFLGSARFSVLYQIAVNTVLQFDTQLRLFLLHPQVRKDALEKYHSFLVGNDPPPCRAMSVFPHRLIHVVDGATKRLLEFIDKRFVAVGKSDVHNIAPLCFADRDMSIGVHCSSSVLGVHVRKYI